MATLLKVSTSSTIKQLTPRFHVCNCLAGALRGDADCGPAKTLYVCISRLAFGRRELALLSTHPSSDKLPDRIIEHAQIWAPLWYDESLDPGRLLRSLSQARFEPRGGVYCTPCTCQPRVSCAWGLLETNHETTTKPQRNHNETTNETTRIFTHNQRNRWFL